MKDWHEITLIKHLSPVHISLLWLFGLLEPYSSLKADMKYYSGFPLLLRVYHDEPQPFDEHIVCHDGSLLIPLSKWLLLFIDRQDSEDDVIKINPEWHKVDGGYITTDADMIAALEEQGYEVHPPK